MGRADQGTGRWTDYLRVIWQIDDRARAMVERQREGKMEKTRIF